MALSCSCSSCLLLASPYYIGPSDPVGQEAFAVIREAMRGKAMVALGRVGRFQEVDLPIVGDGEASLPILTEAGFCLVDYSVLCSRGPSLRDAYIPGDNRGERKSHDESPSSLDPRRDLHRARLRFDPVTERSRGRCREGKADVFERRLLHLSRPRRQGGNFMYPAPPLAGLDMPAETLQAFLRAAPNDMPSCAPTILTNDDIANIDAFLHSLPGRRDPKDFPLLNQ